MRRFFDDNTVAEGDEGMQMKRTPSIRGRLFAYVKQGRENGRCLHFLGGERCHKSIRSHLLQKAFLLESVAEDGHVIVLDSDVSSLHKTGGKLFPKKKGVGRVSVFRGFCAKHDDELFREIDRSPFLPNRKQAFLYGYRSLCKELFMKEVAVNAFRPILLDERLMPHHRHSLEQHLLGFQLGLDRNAAHKQMYDASLADHQWGDIEYVAFNFKGKPTVVAAGCIFPDFDFLGRPLQNLADESKALDLVSFFTTPRQEGWSFVFAWHVRSSASCERLLASLAERKHNGDSLAELLLWCTFAWTESHAINPSWWNGLNPAQRNALCDIGLYMADTRIPIRNNYLGDAPVKFCDWRVDSVQDSRDCDHQC